MTMTLQHFALIAEVINNEFHHATCGQDQRDMLYRVAQSFARKLAATDSNFNRARFLRACGVEE